MASEMRQVLVDVYVNGVFYCIDSFWASDDEDVESAITSAIYDHFCFYKRENVDVQLEEVFSENKDMQLEEDFCEEEDLQLDEASFEEKDVQLEADINSVISELVTLVSKDLTDPAGPSTEVEGSVRKISQDGMDVSPETSEENFSTEFGKVRKTISEFFRTGISPQSKTDLTVSEEAGSSREISQGDMDALSEISEEDIPIDFAKVRKTISEFFRNGISSQPNTDPAVCESLCKVAESSSDIVQGSVDASPEISEEDIPIEFGKVRKTISEFFRTGISPQSKTDLTVSEEAGSSREISQGGMDASSEISEEDIPIDFAKVRKTISEFFRNGNSSQPKTDPAVCESLCKVAESSSDIVQGSVDASPEISEENIPIDLSAFFQKRCEISAQPDMDLSESLCVPAASALEPTSEPMGPELDLVDPEDWSILSSSEPEPVSSEGLVVDISDQTLELRSPTLVSEDLTDPEGVSAEVAGSSSGNDQGGTDASPETPEEDFPKGYVKVRKINKISKLVQKLFGISAQPQKGPATPEPPEHEPQVLENYIPQNISQLKNCLEECTLSETPVTEVWPNIFLGNEETARDRTKLKKMGITHILNAAAVKKKLRVLMGMPKEKDLNGKINTGKKYYRGMDIKYCGLPATHRDGLNMGMYFSPAAKFIQKALRNPENKVLIHCCDGVSHSPSLLLAYLMIHRDMMVEEAIDYVIKVRHIKPSMSSLMQLMSLNAELVELQGNKAAKCH